MIYEKFAGGVLNGIWSEYRAATIDPEFLVMIFNPVVMLLAYTTLVITLTKARTKQKKDWTLYALALIALIPVLGIVFLKIIIG